MRIHYQMLIMLAFPISAFAQGGPPLLTDDPGTPGDGHYEINTALTANFRENEHEFEVPLIDMSFGITERGQLKIEVPLAIERISGHPTKLGASDITLGWKWRFLDQDHVLADISVYPQLSFSPSPRSKTVGLAEHGVAFLLPFEMAHDFGKFSVAAEVGHTFRTQNPGESLFGVAFGWKASNKTEWLAEYHQILSNDAEDRERLINVGLRREVLTHVNLLTSIGSSPNTASSDHNKLAIYFGLQFTN